MLTKYFKFKIKTKDFIQNIIQITETLKDKKVIICGDIEGFNELNKRFDLEHNLNIVGFINFGKNKKCKFQIITPDKIYNKQFDAILITGENSDNIYNTIFYDYKIENITIEKLFFENICDGKQNLEFLLKNNFEKRINSLRRRLKNKKIVLYGAGAFFELIHKYFDLSDLNIIGISDKKFKDTDNIRTFCGYKTYKPTQIESLKPDYVLISLKKFIPIWEDLYFYLLKNKKIRIKPIFTTNIWDFLCEIADS